MNSTSGQSTLQLVTPLLLILLFTLTFAYAMPTMSTGKTLAVAGGIILFMVSFVSSQAALYVLIFSMLLGPEIVVGETGGRSDGDHRCFRIGEVLARV